MKRTLPVIAAALLLGGMTMQAHAQSKMLDITFTPKDRIEKVDLTPSAPHATTSEATGNTRNTVGTTLIDQRDKTLSTDSIRSR
ncbi:MAG: hypothetical protein JSR47_07735 [Proteobacteria bacterium]|nr:hypothetical protein [Pseudomonadota bacterium]